MDVSAATPGVQKRTMTHWSLMAGHCSCLTCARTAGLLSSEPLSSPHMLQVFLLCRKDLARVELLHRYLGLLCILCWEPFILFYFILIFFFLASFGFGFSVVIFPASGGYWEGWEEQRWGKQKTQFEPGFVTGWQAISELVLGDLHLTDRWQDMEKGTRLSELCSVCSEMFLVCASARQ